MTRSTVRELAVLLCYTSEINKDNAEEIICNYFEEGHNAELKDEIPELAEKPSQKQMDYLKELVCGVCDKKEELNSEIDEISLGWKTGRLSKTALAVLQCAFYEIMYMPDVPAGVSASEAVLIAKKYEDPETVAFINGIIGSFIKKQNADR